MKILPALFCITFHELSHGYIAYRLGDNTAKEAGRLTLNPIKHIDVLGLLMMIFVGLGWAKPVPVNMNNFKKPKQGMAITAFAGPLSNIILSAIIMLIYGLAFSTVLNRDGLGGVIQQTLLNTAYLSCALAVFNLIPIPPLDGSKVLFSVLPEKAYYKLMRYEKYGFIIIIVLIWANALTPYLKSAINTMFTWLINIATWSYSFTV